jgi:hypothetical protein
MRGLDLRDGVQGLVVLADRDLSALWQQVSNAAEAQVALNDVLPALIDTYGLAASALAAEWYDELRHKVGVKGSFTAITADIKDTGTHALVGWAGSTATDLSSMQELVLGGMQRRIANFSRQTVMDSSVADPQARGWQRVGVGECKNGFCDMLIARGAVYSEATADFAAHDHCKCSAIPAFGGEPRPVKPYTVSPRRKIDPETGKPVIDANYLRAKEWLANH